MDRFINSVDRISGLCLGAVALLTFSESVLRYLFSLQIPDWYTLACLFQGIAIFWGISSTTYEGKHICVDVIWEAGGPGVKRALDLLADTITVGFLAVFGWMLMQKVESVYTSNQVSPDLSFQVWPYYLMASLGIAASVVLGAVRLYRTTIRVY